MSDPETFTVDDTDNDPAPDAPDGQELDDTGVDDEPGTDSEDTDAA